MEASERSGLPGMAGGSSGFSTKEVTFLFSSMAVTPKAFRFLAIDLDAAHLTPAPERAWSASMRA